MTGTRRCWSSDDLWKYRGKKNKPILHSTVSSVSHTRTLLMKRRQIEPAWYVIDYVSIFGTRLPGTGNTRYQVWHNLICIYMYISSPIYSPIRCDIRYTWYDRSQNRCQWYDTINVRPGTAVWYHSRKTDDKGNAMLQSFLSKLFKKEIGWRYSRTAAMEKRGEKVCFVRIICSRCCTRRNLRFHVENCQHADQQQLTRR